MRTATLLESRRVLGYKTCEECPVERLVRAPGDVAMCSCGQWWAHSRFMGAVAILPVTPEHAARLAREPMPAYEVLDALERGAAELARFTA